eukprot:8834240-Lingulodinium_polyedra.AAC.1
MTNWIPSRALQTTGTLGARKTMLAPNMMLILEQLIHHASDAALISNAGARATVACATFPSLRAENATESAHAM